MSIFDVEAMHSNVSFRARVEGVNLVCVFPRPFTSFLVPTQETPMLATTNKQKISKHNGAVL